MLTPRFAAFAALTIAATVFAAAGSANDRFSVALIRSATNAPFYIGHDLGLFESEGVTVELKYFQASTAIAVAVVSGDADVGATAFTAGFYNLAGKGAIKVVGGTGLIEPGYPLTGYVASRQAHATGLTSVRDLSGRTFATTTIGAPSYFALHLLARKHGFDYAAVRTTPMQSLANALAAVTSGQIDVTFVPINMALAAKDRGEVVIIGWDDEVPYQLSGFFTSTRNIRERRAVVERFVRGFQKSAKAYAENFLARDGSGKRLRGPDYDRMLAIIAAHTGQKPDQIAASTVYVDPAGRLKVRDLYEQIAFWQSLGQVDAGVKAPDVMDLSFIDGHFDVPAR